MFGKKKSKKIMNKKIRRNYDQYFSKNYWEARNKFLKQAQGLKIISRSVQENLTIDVAFSDSGKKDKLLIIVSGVHGVEGYTGSALQLLFLEKYLPLVKKDFSVLLIHAYNPYGFYLSRRVNENNVDLNRNCLETFELTERQKNILHIIKKYEKLIAPTKSRMTPLIEAPKHKLTLIRSLISNGVKKTIIAGTSGQNIYPWGAGYVGIKSEKSTSFFQRIIKEVTGDYEKVFLLDVHTGLGTKYGLKGFSFNAAHTPEFHMLKRLNKKTKSRINSNTVNHQGSLGAYFVQQSKAKKKIDLVIEFGTLSRVSGALSLSKLSTLNVAENQITHFGPSQRLEKIRKKLRKAYYPETKTYKMFVVLKSEDFLGKLCDEFRRM